jgi:hypothetical protein
MYTSLRALNPASRVEEAPVGCERWPAWGTRSASWRARVRWPHSEPQALGGVPPWSGVGCPSPCHATVPERARSVSAESEREASCP